MCETKHCHNTKENDLLKKASQIEPKRQDIIQQLKNDCKSVSNRINQWIIALVSLIGALVPTFVADCSKINLFVRSVVLGLIVLVIILIGFDEYLLNKLERLLQERIENLLFNEDVAIARKRLHEKSKRINKLKYAILAVIVALVVLMVVQINKCNKSF